MDKLDYLGIGGPAAAVYAFFTAKRNKEDIEKIESSADEIKAEIYDLRIHMAEHYATNDSVEKKFSAIETHLRRIEDNQTKSLRRIENKMDKKADK